MKINHEVVALVATFVIAASAIAVGQDRDPAAQAKAAAQIAQEMANKAREDEARRQTAMIKPLKVQIVISKYQGDKKVSSMPYSLSVNSNDGKGARLRMGTQVPLPTVAAPVIDGKPMEVFGGPVQYKEIGTYIDCAAELLPDGRFQLVLAVEDSSVYTDNGAGAPGQQRMTMPAIRSFKLTNTAVLRDGETTQFTTATDRLTGEVTKIDVTLTVVK